MKRERVEETHSRTRFFASLLRGICSGMRIQLDRIMVKNLCERAAQERASRQLERSPFRFYFQLSLNYECKQS